MTDRDYEVGESVAVPWGLDTVDGVVVGAYGEGGSRRVLVEVNVDDDVTETIPFPPHALELARVPETHSPPGSWVDAARFENSVRSALLQALHDLKPNWEGQVHSEVPIGPGQRIDMAIELSDRLLIVEVKYFSQGVSSRDASSFDQLRYFLSQLREQGFDRAVALLVVNRQPSEPMLKRAYGLRSDGFPVWVLAWEPENRQAETDLHNALSAAIFYDLSGA
ncbi:hypothetical protein [Streptomyces sp. B1-3]|uniref:hypothetical protein n=1 Tax=Streptomyces sp. B1-3 TaxID=3141453 RepID=UPI003D2E5AC7